MIRVDGRINIDDEIANGNIIIDEEEQRGSKDRTKFWFNNYSAMYKQVYPKTYEDYAELIAYRLAEYLGLESAFYDLATYNGKHGVITSNLVKDNENEEMISGAEIISQVYSEYILPIIIVMDEYKELMSNYNVKNINEFIHLRNDKQIEFRDELIKLINRINSKNIGITKKIYNNIYLTQVEEMFEYLDSFNDIYNKDFTEMKNGIIKSNNLYDIWSVLDIYSKINNVNLNVQETMDKLINMFIFDIITSQGDRHAENWSIIKNNKNNSVVLCPLYDNSSLCCLNREKAIKNIIEYTNQLSNPSLHDNKKAKISSLLSSTINHSNSGLKVDLEDVNTKNRNITMVEKFWAHSSDLFRQKMMDFVSRIDEGVLDSIFNGIEKSTDFKVPDEVKFVTKLVIMNNIKMINEISNERGLAI